MTNCSGRFRITLKDGGLIKVIEGLQRVHRAVFVEMALKQYLATSHGQDTLSVLASHSGKLNENKGSCPQQGDGTAKRIGDILAEYS